MWRLQLPVSRFSRTLCALAFLLISQVLGSSYGALPPGKPMLFLTACWFFVSFLLFLSANLQKHLKMFVWGAWVAHSVKLLTSARVMISGFKGSSPASGSVLTAGSLQPASDSVCVSLSLCLSPARPVSLSLKNKH